MMTDVNIQNMRTVSTWRNIFYSVLQNKFKKYVLTYCVVIVIIAFSTIFFKKLVYIYLCDKSLFYV